MNVNDNTFERSVDMRGADGSLTHGRIDLQAGLLRHGGEAEPHGHLQTGAAPLMTHLAYALLVVFVQANLTLPANVPRLFLLLVDRERFFLNLGPGAATPWLCSERGKP